MRITLSPQRRDDHLTLSRIGDTLVINGEAFDFSVVPEGASLPAEAVASDFVIGGVERLAGVLHIGIVLPHGASPSPAVAFPEPIIDPPDGPIALPADEIEEDVP